MASNSQATNYSSVVTLGFINLNMLPSVYLTAAIGSQYEIEAAPALAPTNWTVVTNITIPTQPYIYGDYTSVTNKMQFWPRGAAIMAIWRSHMFVRTPKAMRRTEYKPNSLAPVPRDVMIVVLAFVWR